MGNHMNEPQEFANRKEAAAWLVDQKWKVSRSTFYKHCSEGRVRPNASGGFDRAALLRYARLHLAQMDVIQTMASEDLAKNKQKAEILRSLEQGKYIKLKREQLSGSLISRSEVELQMAGRAAAFDSSLKYSLTLKAADMIETVLGDPAKKDELIRLLHDIVDAALHPYSAPLQIEVIFIPSQTEEAPHE
jgi:hypothetical protein